MAAISPVSARIFLFDVDMTLLDAGGAGRAAFDLAFHDVLGVEHVFDGYRFFGGVDLAIVGDVYARITGSPVPAATLAALRDRYLERLDEAIARTSRYRVLPGSRELLERLVATPGCRLGLATGNFEAGAWKKLRAVGLDRYFRTGGFGSDAADRVEMTRIALRRVRGLDDEVVEAHTSYVVGDSPRDLKAARACGAHAIGVATGSASRDELARHRPFLVVDGLDELLGRLDELL